MTFLVLEGIDGAGTTTQLGRIADALRAQGHRVHTTAEPSEGPLGQLLRQALRGRLRLPGGSPLGDETLALLFAADRADHLEAEIRPARARGEIVLCDRYVLSSMAYQGAALGLGHVAALNARADASDLTLFLSLDPAVAAERRRKRGGPEELFDSEETQLGIARLYEEALAYMDPAKVARIDGSLPPEEITRQALDAIARRGG